MKAGKVFLLLVVFVLFLLDRIFKKLALPPTSFESADFFSLTYFLNKAGPFSLNLPTFFLILAAGLIMVWLTYIGYESAKQNSLLRFMGASLMIAGGFSNFLDRLLVGGVIDYWQAAILTGLNFNLADVYLCIGVILVIGSYYQPAVKNNNQ